MQKLIISLLGRVRVLGRGVVEVLKDLRPGSPSDEDMADVLRADRRSRRCRFADRRKFAHK